MYVAVIQSPSDALIDMYISIGYRNEITETAAGDFFIAINA